MITVQISFPWGRYHAHPWGINPARLREPEWPPSPWRLLRALVSAWFRGHPGQAPSQHCIACVEALGRELPEIGMGKVSFGCTVHWQPNYGATGAEEKASAAYKKTRHENHFAAVHGPVFFRWVNLELPPELRRLLADLLAELAFFGRAESLCHAGICDSVPREGDTGWCVPMSGRRIGSAYRDVFCPSPADFQFTDLWMRRKALPSHDPNNAPPHLVDALLGSEMRPDGAAWISYRMAGDWPHKRLVRIARTARPVHQPAPGEGPKLARYLCFSLQCRVPIPPKFVVPISERFRAAANAHLCKSYGDGTPSFAMFGHERPSDAVGDHQHAFYLPMAERSASENEPGKEAEHFLRYLHIWCPYGFTQAEVQILQSLQRLDWGGGRYPVRPVLIALSLEPPPDAPFSTGQKPARLWRSASPFVPPRYFYRGGGAKTKLKEKDRPELQLAECLKASGVNVSGEIRRFPFLGNAMRNDPPSWEIVRVELGEETAGGESLVKVPVHRNGSDRQRGFERRIGGFFQIDFDEPVAIKQPALGHSCHFGLGLFVPAEPTGIGRPATP